MPLIIEGQEVACVGDPTTHGSPLSPGPGTVTVLCEGRPLWKVLASVHACPVVKGVVPDVGGVVMQGAIRTMAEGMFIARKGDIVVEIPGGPNPIVVGMMGAGGGSDDSGSGSSDSDSDDSDDGYDDDAYPDDQTVTTTDNNSDASASNSSDASSSDASAQADTSQNATDASPAENSASQDAAGDEGGMCQEPATNSEQNQTPAGNPDATATPQAQPGPTPTNSSATTATPEPTATPQAQQGPAPTESSQAAPTSQSEPNISESQPTPTPTATAGPQPTPTATATPQPTSSPIMCPTTPDEETIKSNPNFEEANSADEFLYHNSDTVYKEREENIPKNPDGSFVRPQQEYAFKPDPDNPGKSIYDPLHSTPNSYPAHNPEHVFSDPGGVDANAEAIHNETMQNLEDDAAKGDILGAGKEAARAVGQDLSTAGLNAAAAIKKGWDSVTGSEE